MRKIVYLAIVLLLFTCKKDVIENPDCESLLTGLTELNDNIVKNEIEKLTADLHPQPYSEDPIGHMANVQTLADRLSEKCSQLTTEVVCYACIESYPPRSIISVEFNNQGETYLIYIFIYTPDNDILRFESLARQ